MNHTENWIGSQYKKVVYREYTNGEFVEIKARPPQEQHLELLGMAQTATRTCAHACTHTPTHTHKSIRLTPENGGKEQSSLSAFSQVQRPLPALPFSGSILCAQPTQRIVMVRLQDNTRQESISSRQSNLSVALKFFFYSSAEPGNFSLMPQNSRLRVCIT